MQKNIYLCGPTVYNTPHIGNMRPIISFDIFIRSLNHLGISTKLVHNITDIDDKIIQKAKEEKVSEQVIAQRYEAEYKELLLNYNVNTIDDMPRVTDNMKQILNFIEKLVEAGFAYESNGDVYFNVAKDPKYASLSNRSLDEMKYEDKGSKKHPADFALWKRTTEGVTFDSAWSQGRPGWHTECVVFINELFHGRTIDIHGGGIDLLFPHHENEAAQFRVMHNREMTKDWKHMGHLSIDGKKMSKSLKNDMSAFDFVDNFDADTLRFIFLHTNPFSPIDINDDLINQSTQMVSKWTSLFLKTQVAKPKEVQVNEIATLISEWKFAEANKLINEAIKNFNKTGSKEDASIVYSVMKLLGFNFSKMKVSNEEMDLIKKWEQLKENKEYEEADEIRNQLKELGLV